MGVLLGRGGGDIHVYNILQGLGALGGGRTRYATPACRGVGVLLGRGRGGTYMYIILYGEQNLLSV